MPFLVRQPSRWAAASRAHAVLRRLIAGLAVSAVMIVTPVVAAETPDDVMLRLERVAPDYAALPKLVDVAAAAAQKRSGDKAVADRENLRKAAQAAFDPREAVHAIRTSLSAVPSSDVSTGLLASAADRFLAAVDAVRDADPEAAASLARQARTDLAARPDASRIEALAGAMAAPALAAEEALTGRRMERAIAIPAVEDMSRLAAMDPAAVKTAAASFIAGTRAADDQGETPPFDGRAAAARAMGLSTVALLKLSEDDLRVLSDFYASETGQAKRKALVAAFAGQVDADGTRMMTSYLSALQRLDSTRP